MLGKNGLQTKTFKHHILFIVDFEPLKNIWDVLI